MNILGWFFRQFGVPALLTVVLECGLHLAIYRKPKLLPMAAAVNLCTNLAVNAGRLVCLALGVPLWPVTVAGELCAVAAEWAVYRAEGSCRRPLLFALGANAFSLIIGWVLLYLLP